MIADEIPNDYAVANSVINTRRLNALMITGIILPFLLLPFLSLIFLSYCPDYTSRLICSRFLIWVAVGLLYLYARKAEMQNFVLWNEEKYDTWFYVKSIVVLYLLCFVAGMIARIPFWLGLHESNAVLMKAALIMKQYPVFMVFAAITAGITEELVFRGYILTRLSLFFKNKHYPVIISALLFSFIHITYKTVHELVFTFMLGLLFGYYYQKYRNLTLLIILHSLIDIVAFMLVKVHK